MLGKNSLPLFLQSLPLLEKANATEVFSLCTLVVVLCLGNTIPLVDLGRKSGTMIILCLFTDGSLTHG